MDEKNLSEQIEALKAERGALVLAHYYEDDAVRRHADFVGDSFELAKRATEAKEDFIVFCGVRFMGESVKLLSPEKTVVMASASAGCPMADTVTPAAVAALREEYPDAAVVCYVNSSASTKAMCDICCTSSNAERVVRSLDARRVIFVPDVNLGSYIARLVPEKEIILYDGCCPVHDQMTAADVAAAKARYPDALFLVHPECKPEVIAQADFVGSTSGIIRFASASERDEFIIGTENGVADLLSRTHPKKRFYPLSPRFICPDMKKTTKEDLAGALLYGTGEVTVPEDVAERARIPLARMMEIK